MALSPLLHSYDHVLLDLDGCIWIGDECIVGAPEALGELRSAGKGIAFLTNDSRRSPRTMFASCGHWDCGRPWRRW